MKEDTFHDKKMTKHEIYEHLARVYIGKTTQAKKAKRNKNSKDRLIKQVVLTLLILLLGFYGLSAFLSKRNLSQQSRVIFALSNSPIRIDYNLNNPYPSVKSFSIPIPQIDVTKYKEINFSIRGLEQGAPGIVKIVIKNRKNETAFYFIDGVNVKWQHMSIPLEKFSAITDWTNLTDVSFVFEAWNVASKKGVVLIEDVCFEG